MKPQIIKADKSNKDWNYMALCIEHGFLLEAQTKKELATIKTMHFCSECYEVDA